MVGHGGSSAGLYLVDPTSPIPSHCVSIVATSTLRVIYGTSRQMHLHTQHNTDVIHAVQIDVSTLASDTCT